MRDPGPPTHPATVARRASCKHGIMQLTITTCDWSPFPAFRVGTRTAALGLVGSACAVGEVHWDTLELLRHIGAM